MNSQASYLTLLQNQLNQIDDREFDFASWKNATILLITTCFGANSPQVAALDKIDYNYSSWALRDESGTSDPVKRECKTTLSTIIKEFEIRLESNSEGDKITSEAGLDFVWLPFEDELTGASLKKLKSILTQANVSSDEVEAFLKDLPNQTLVNIIQTILLSKEFKQWICK
ncbi:MAG: hypothetical protein MI866_14715 [Bacteroidales bacterium]|nr:hypothetical protein [Bacteroidales bacterium]